MGSLGRLPPHLGRATYACLQAAARSRKKPLNADPLETFIAPNTSPIQTLARLSAQHEFTFVSATLVTRAERFLNRYAITKS